MACKTGYARGGQDDTIVRLSFVRNGVASMTMITAEMEAELIRLFNRFDTDKSGSIDEREFGLILDSLGYDESPEVRSLEFAAIDDDDDGKLRFQEFADWWLDNR